MGTISHNGKRLLKIHGFLCSRPLSTSKIQPEEYHPHRSISRVSICADINSGIISCIHPLYMFIVPLMLCSCNRSRNRQIKLQESARNTKYKPMLQDATATPMYPSLAMRPFSRACFRYAFSLNANNYYYEIEDYGESSMIGERIAGVSCLI